jgi:hypothetical protein
VQPPAPVPRVAAHEDGAWVADAAAAYAAKQARRPRERADRRRRPRRHPAARRPATEGGKPGSQPLWEVFVRSKRGLSHTHAGSLHAPDAHMALRNARDLYTRRRRA